MNVKNFFENIKHINYNVMDNLGLFFLNTYNTFPLHYRIYIDNNKKPTYIRGTAYFSDIKNNIKYNIDTRKFINNIIKNSNADPWNEYYDNSDTYIMCTDGGDYIIMGKKYEFVIYVHVPSNEKDATEETISIYCNPNHITNIMKILSPYIQVSDRNTTYSFGIASMDNSRIYTVWYDYSKKDIDIDKNYNDDFKEPYDKICNLITNKDETGLVLLYGEPGTGKSSVIKNLITKYHDTEFVFLDDSIIGGASQSGLISYFIESQNTVFILEDCEKVLMSREKGYNPVINTLLNITDGIIGDVLGIKLICTFNTSLDNIDKALLRKGRLSVKYEFKKLHKDKVSKILGKEVKEDMTLADIYNIDDENDFSKVTRNKIGF